LHDTYRDGLHFRGESQKQPGDFLALRFGEMRSSGVTGIMVYCADFKCSDMVKVAAPKWPDEVRLSDIEDRFVCQVCGKRGADIRPDFPKATMGSRNAVLDFGSGRFEILTVCRRHCCRAVLRSGMAEYRAFKVGKDGYFTEAVPMTCSNDAEAIENATRLLDDNDVDLWLASRMVTKLIGRAGAPGIKPEE